MKMRAALLFFGVLVNSPLSFSSLPCAVLFLDISAEMRYTLSFNPTKVLDYYTVTPRELGEVDKLHSRIVSILTKNYSSYDERGKGAARRIVKGARFEDAILFYEENIAKTGESDRAFLVRSLLDRRGEGREEQTLSFFAANYRHIGEVSRRYIFHWVRNRFGERGFALLAEYLAKGYQHELSIEISWIKETRRELHSSESLRALTLLARSKARERLISDFQSLFDYLQLCAHLRERGSSVDNLLSDEAALAERILRAPETPTFIRDHFSETIH